MSLAQDQSFSTCHASGGEASGAPTDPLLLCKECQAGCNASKTANSTEEEISAAPYLLLAAVVIVLVSVTLRWFL